MSTTNDIVSRALGIAQTLADRIDALLASDTPEEAWAADDELCACLDTIEAVSPEIPGKLDAVRAVRARLAAEAETIRGEEKRLAARRKSVEKAESRLAGLGLSLLRAWAALGHEPRVGREDGANGSHWIARSQSIRGPEDPAAWPAEWQRTKIEPDRAAALKAARAGDFLPEGFETVETETWSSR